MMDRHSVAELFAVAAAVRQRLPLRDAGRTQRMLSRLFAAAFLASRSAPLQWRFEMLLGEPSAAARTMVYDWFFYKQLERASWAGTLPRARDGALLDAGRVADYLRRCERGVVIATIHMGDYLDGLRRLYAAAPAQRPIFVFRRKEWSDAEQRTFDRIADGQALTVLRRGTRSVATAVRELRRGAILVALYDLPARYGRTTTVDFFDHDAQFVRGPAELAVACDADVLPLLCHYDDGGAAIAEVMPIIVAARAPAETRDARVAAVTQSLCTLAERHIRANPSQWAHWSLIDELIPPSPPNRSMPR